MTEPIPQETGMTRRALLRRAARRAAVGLLGGTAAAAGYGLGVAPYRPVLERVDVPLPGLPPALDGFTIAHLSDFHVQPRFPASRLSAAVEMANQARPDVIALTGDYINYRLGFRAEHMAACARALSALRARHGVFAAFGNHDFPAPPAGPDRRPWEAAGITPLLDEALPLPGARAPVWVVGLQSYLVRPCAPGPVLAVTPPDAVRILLWHEPDRAPEAAAAGASLQLSGHTHGGQVVLPEVGPLALPAAGKRYPAGLYVVDGMPLYVTRGVGLLPPMVRLNCPPEVTLLTLRRAR